MSKLVLLNEENLFEFESEETKEEEQLPIELFQEIEAELCDHILHTAEGHETDGTIDFIKEIVENIKLEIDSVVQNNNKKTFLNTLSKIITILLSVKVDTPEKIIKIVKLIVSTALKKWSE